MVPTEGDLVINNHIGKSHYKPSTYLCRECGFMWTPPKLQTHSIIQKYLFGTVLGIGDRAVKEAALLS